LSTTVDGSAVDERFDPSFTVVHDGSTWTVSTPLAAEEIRQFGVDVIEKVELAGIRVEHLRLLIIPAVLLIVGAVTALTIALRRTPALTIEALLRRPGISAIDLE